MDVKINLNENDLICPVTYQVFCDSIVAGDGHVYERSAIVRWIEEHGTSPLIRQPLTVNELQSDDYLKKLAAQRQNSSTSSNSCGCVIFSFIIYIFVFERISQQNGPSD